MLKKNYVILAIETSLDDTCAAVTSDDRVLSNVVASQTAFHEEFGGTVPHIAKRKHQEWLRPTIQTALTRARVKLKEVDAVAVTYGPGLAPCLEVGIETAKTLAREEHKPLVAVNHMEGHLLSSLAKNGSGRGNQLNRQMLPALGFLISGGHTELVLMKDVGTYELLGQTLDDAAGEAYDKVARMLNLGYPGGPILTELAKQGDPKAIPFPEPMRLRNDLNFSFSGLKTAALYKIRELTRADEDSFRNRYEEDSLRKPMSRQFCADFAASFQQAVIKMLTRRVARAIRLYSPRSIWLGGGVVSNVAIRTAVRKVGRSHGLTVYIPYTQRLYTDNGAMIGVTAWHKALRGEWVDDLAHLDRKPNLSF